MQRILHSKPSQTEGKLLLVWESSWLVKKKNKGKMINSSQHREEETSYLSACFAFSDKESENVAHVNILVFVNKILWLVYDGPAKCSSHYLHSFQMFPQFPLYGNWSYLNYSNLKAYSGTLSRRNFGRFKAT